MIYSHKVRLNILSSPRGGYGERGSAGSVKAYRTIDFPLAKHGTEQYSLSCPGKTSPVVLSSLFVAFPHNGYRRGGMPVASILNINTQRREGLPPST